MNTAVFVLFCAAVAGAAPARPALDGIVLGPGRIVLHLSGRVQEKIGLFPDPPRLVIDLPNTEFASSIKEAAADDGLFGRVRAGQFVGGDAPISRVVVDLKKEVSHRAVWSGRELTIELEDKDGAVPAAGPAAAADSEAPGGMFLEAAKRNRSIAYEGTLTDPEGNPLTGTFLATLRCPGGAHEEERHLTAESGRFTVVLGEDPPLSEAAFEACGRVEVVKSKFARWRLGGSPVSVEVGSFSDPDRALTLASELRSRFSSAFVVRGETGGKKLYHVRTGPYADAARAETERARLEKMGFKGKVLKDR